MHRTCPWILAAVLCAPVSLSAQENGEKAFRSYAELVVGGVWTCEINGEVYEDRYEWMPGGKFIKLVSKGVSGAPGGESIMGVDPQTGESSWWSFMEDGRVEKGTSRLVDPGKWESKSVGTGPQGPVQGQAVLTRVDANTIRFEVQQQGVINIPPVTIWRRVADVPVNVRRWREFLSGTWSYTIEPDNRTGVVTWSIVADGRSLLGFHTDSSGGTSVETDGWRADAKTLSVHGYGSSDNYWQLDFAEDKIDKDLMTGSNRGVLPDGRPYHGKFFGKRVDDDTYEWTFEGVAGDKPHAMKGVYKRKK